MSLHMVCRLLSNNANIWSLYVSLFCFCFLSPRSLSSYGSGYEFGIVFEGISKNNLRPRIILFSSRMDFHFFLSNEGRRSIHLGYIYISTTREADGWYPPIRGWMKPSYMSMFKLVSLCSTFKPFLGHRHHTRHPVVAVHVLHFLSPLCLVTDAPTTQESLRMPWFPLPQGVRDGGPSFLLAYPVDSDVHVLTLSLGQSLPSPDMFKDNKPYDDISACWVILFLCVRVPLGFIHSFIQ